MLSNRILGVYIAHIHRSATCSGTCCEATPYQQAGWMERPAEFLAFWNFPPAAQSDRINPYVGLLSTCSTVAPKPDQTLLYGADSCSAVAQSAVRTFLRVCIVK